MSVIAVQVLSEQSRGTAMVRLERMRDDLEREVLCLALLSSSCPAQTQQLKVELQVLRRGQSISFVLIHRDILQRISLLLSMCSPLCRRRHYCLVIYLFTGCCPRSALPNLLCIDTSRFTFTTFTSNRVCQALLGMCSSWGRHVLLNMFTVTPLPSPTSHSALCLRLPISFVLIHWDFVH